VVHSLRQDSAVIITPRAAPCRMQVDDILLRLGLALLAEAQEEILLLDGEGLQLNFKRIIARLPADRIIVGALSTRVPVDSNSLRDIKHDLERGVLTERGADTAGKGASREKSEEEGEGRQKGEERGEADTFVDVKSGAIASESEIVIDVKTKLGT
jgi:hypothetical protein